MSRPWRLWSLILAVLLVVVAACTSRAEPGGETATQADTVLTQLSTTEELTTSTTRFGPDVPAVLVANEAGLVLWKTGELDALVAGRPIRAAFPDLMGGVVFQEQSLAGQIRWLPSGETDPVVLVDPGVGIGIHLLDVAVVAERPVVVYRLVYCPQPAYCESDLMVRDLASRAERSMGLIGGFEWGASEIAVGGEMVLQRWGDYDGCCNFIFTNVIDGGGEEVVNPCLESSSCDTGAISPDGSLLAYTRPGLPELKNQPVPGTELLVVDLQSGTEVWRTTHDGSVRDFDGTWILVSSSGDPADPDQRLSLRSMDGLVIDLPIRGAARLWWDAEVQVPMVSLAEHPDPRGSVGPNKRMVAGPVEPPSWTVILDSISVGDDAQETDTGLREAQGRAETARRDGIPTGVLRSDDYVTLNPGYWVVYSGNYTTREEAASACAELQPMVGFCYTRYLATAETIDSEVTATPPSLAIAPKLGVMTDLTEAGPVGDLGVCNRAIGSRLTEGGIWHAVMWLNGELIDIGMPSNQVWTIYLADVNTRGQAVGSFNQEGRTIAFLWEDGQWTELWFDGAVGTAAWAINDSGQIAVTSNSPDGRQTYLWQDGVFTLVGGELYPADINERGDLTGHIPTAEGLRAFLWSQGTLTQFGTLGGSLSNASGLGEDGSVLGAASTANGHTHAFRWIDGVMTDLGTLGGDLGVATAVNSVGQIVGYSNLTARGPTHAFLWEEGTMYDLGTLGNWTAARCINDSGTVTGIYQATSGYLQPFVWRR